METIYKKDSKGKTRYLTISTRGNEIIQVSGVLDGTPVTNISVCVPKNIGKSNATTGPEQAIIEAKAKIEKKLGEGYCKTQYELIENTLITPMLAKDFKVEESRVKYPCFVQPKLDGMRCLKNNKTLTSRGNKVISTMDHIRNIDIDPTSISKIIRVDIPVVGDAKSILTEWWQGLNNNRGDRAELKRVQKPDQVVFISTFHKLHHQLQNAGLKISNEKLALVAGLLAKIRECNAQNVSQQMGGSEEAPLISKLRMRRLLETEIKKLEREYADLEEIWKAEKASLQGTQHIKEQLEQAKMDLETASSKTDLTKMS